MPNTCEFCGKEFYSDTEFEEHQARHQVEKSVQQVIEGQKLATDNFLEIGKKLEAGVWQIIRRIELSVVYQIAADKDLSYREASEEYIRMVNTNNEVAKEQYEIEQNNKAEAEKKAKEMKP